MSGYQAKDGTNKANGKDIAFQDKQEALDGFFFHQRQSKRSPNRGDCERNSGRSSNAPGCRTQLGVD